MGHECFPALPRNGSLGFSWAARFPRKLAARFFETERQRARVARIPRGQARWNQGAAMQAKRDIEALKAEWVSLEAMLADLEIGKIPHGLGNPFEDRDRQIIIRRRIEKIKSTLSWWQRN
jgi:hypothetical protein